MTPFEYSLALVSILIGLAVADLATCLHRLLRARNRVRWDWLPLASALLVMLLILQFWWGFYRLGTAPIWTHYGAFLILVATLIVIFLLASAALPDDVPESGLDLARYYEENARYFWSLFGLFVMFAVAVQLATMWDGSGVMPDAGLVLSNVGFAAVLFSLAWFRSRRYHAAVVLVLLVLLTLDWSRLRLRDRSSSAPVTLDDPVPGAAVRWLGAARLEGSRLDVRASGGPDRA